MFDAAIRPYINPPLARIATALVKAGVRANHITVTGFVLGMLSVVLIAMQAYLAALALLVLSRVCDGLDGAVARQTKLSDVGGFLDITLDFIFYASVVLGFALADPAQNALAAAFLAVSFMGPACTFLAYAIFAAKYNITTDIRGAKSLYYLGGLTEGTETIVTFMVMCVFPSWFPVIAVIYGVLCWITAGTRIYAGVTTFGALEREEAPQ
ncbi:MAG TPA: CDP-alcohol phosphatidyltransferase [Alphaproteobacteria bacterium]|nr:CDP-alcohol phosphatidyltransferase [Alphaproteobacteria bacterium]HAJ47682.1 CDP-alcohol phosphatidyltransferase [Alphaproteobacteria bacterium]